MYVCEDLGVCERACMFARMFMCSVLGASAPAMRIVCVCVAERERERETERESARACVRACV